MSNDGEPDGDVEEECTTTLSVICVIVVSAPAWDGTGCEFDSCMAASDKYLIFIEPTITWVPLGFSGYILFDTKIVLIKSLSMEPDGDVKRSVRRLSMGSLTWM